MIGQPGPGRKSRAPGGALPQMVTRVRFAYPG